MPIDKKTALPLHYQLTTLLREKLLQESWQLGDLFPKEKDLMTQYELSSTTVRRALAELVQEGWLERKAGKGTFVRKLPTPEAVGRLMGFFHEMNRRGLQPTAQTLALQTVDFAAFSADAGELAQAFRPQPLFLIERLVSLNNRPAACIKSYWPEEIGRQLSGFDLSHEGLYELAARYLSLSLSKAEQIIAAREADETLAALLQVAVGAPLLITKRMAFAGDKPMEYSVSYYRADSYDFRVTLYQGDQQGITPSL